MKITIILLVTIFVVSFAQDKYTTKYDNIDLDEIIGNKRLLKNYVNCLLETGTCTPDGQELKRKSILFTNTHYKHSWINIVSYYFFVDVLPEALQSGCGKCNEKQKEGAKRILRHLVKNEAEWYNELEKKYDPTGEYRKKYEAEVKEE